MSESDRSDLLRNAVEFLADSKTQESPLLQRIQFLEAKGLSQPEIDQAIREASNRSRITQNLSYYSPGNPSAITQLHSNPRPDWRDYFIISVVSGTLLYATVALARRYLLPHLQPPNQTQYEQDVSSLNAQFEAIEGQLNTLKSDFETTRLAGEAQREKVSGLVVTVETAVEELREGERKSRDELREIREEVDVIRDMLPKMLEKNKEGSNAALLELQQELKSLKTLLISSNARPLATSIPSGLPATGTRPTIPAWQLSMSTSSSASTPEAGTPISKATPEEG